MHFICVLIFIFLSSDPVNGSMDELILSLFSKDYVCNWSKSFLLGVQVNTILYVDEKSVFEIDFKANTLIGRQYKYDYFSDYFTGCLIKLKSGTVVYVVIYQDRIYNLTSEYFQDSRVFRWVNRVILT